MSYDGCFAPRGTLYTPDGTLSRTEGVLVFRLADGKVNEGHFV